MIDNDAHALADGFALQVERWARALGDDAATAASARQAAHALSLATGDGHVCLPLADLPDGDDLRRVLLSSQVVGTPAAPGACPLILDADDRLYLHRHFDHERRLAQRLMRAADAPAQAVDAATQQRLNALFGNEAGPDWQKLAAALALRQRLVVISGGPGTGKTTTVVNLLACLIEQNPEVRIALAAPTGKAAARMSEALRQRAQHLPPALRERLPAQAATVHRLLGAFPGGFTHHAGRPLAIDALVVDEASMLDLALATQLLEAVPDSARLILLGDKDQLAAVESGAVFAELSADPTLSAACIDDLARLCELPAAAIVPGAPLEASPLRDSVVWLSRNFRFAADSGIAHGGGQRARWPQRCAAATPAPARRRQRCTGWTTAAPHRRRPPGSACATAMRRICRRCATTAATWPPSRKPSSAFECCAPCARAGAASRPSTGSWPTRPARCWRRTPPRPGSPAGR